MTIHEFIEYNKKEGDGPSSITGVSKMLGVSRQTVYNWSTGRFCPSFDHVMLLVQLSGGKISRINDSNVVNLKVRNMFRVARDFYENWDDTMIVIHPEGLDG